VRTVLPADGRQVFHTAEWQPGSYTWTVQGARGTQALRSMLLR
jgi:hypothetical protein